MHSRLTYIAAQQHIADLHRTADHNRLAHAATNTAATAAATAATTATTTHAVPGCRHAAAASLSVLSWLRRRLA